MSERDLYCAVLEQALDDAQAAYTTPETKRLNNFTLEERRNAIAFIEDEYGAWARSRRDVCNAAGICPDAFRERCLKELAKTGTLAGIVIPKGKPRTRGGATCTR